MIERYDRDKHLPMMRAWCEARGTPLPWDAADYYPRTGFVARDCAASFLFLTDSMVGYVDGTLADPRVDSLERSLALDEVLQAVIDEAKSLGLKALQTFTSVPTLIAKVPKLGARVQADGLTYIAWRF